MGRLELARWALVALGATATACTLNVRYEAEELEASYDRSGWSVLRVEPEPAPRLVVSAHGQPRIDATLTVDAVTDVHGDELGSITDGLALIFEEHGEDLVSLYPEELSGDRGRGLVELWVAVPRPAGLDLVIGSTDTTVIGLCGPVTITGDSADVLIETLGPIEVDLGSGNVVALADLGTIRTGSGDIDADLLGNAVLDANAGNIVATLGAGGMITTGSGDVEIVLTNPEFGSLTVSTGSGDVVIQLPPGAAPTLELLTGSGDVTVADGLMAAEGSTGGDHILVDTGSGDVVIEY